jgi:2',3'-cyclic-nucleotide 2'-phosphodiesterase (5'-nucleotidase family)
VDSGNLLFKYSTIAQGQTPETIKAAGIIEAYTKMGYDAVAVGPLDLVAGIDFLKNHISASFPWISANLVKGDHSPIFKPYIIVDTGQIKTGIIGLTQKTGYLPANLHVVDWQTVLPALIRKLSKECDRIILLSNLPPKDNNDIAKSFPDIRIIISADLQSGNLPPILNNNTLITQTSAQGQHLGMLTIDWGDSGRWDSDSNPSTFTSSFISLSRSLPNSSDIERIISDITRQIQNLNRQPR